MSPLLLVLVMEALGRMLDKAIHDDHMSGFGVGNLEGRSLAVSHLHFVDNTLIFCEANLDQILFLRTILIWFEVVFGLNINLGKSKLVLVGVVHNFDLLLNVLGCKQGTLPMKYLGLPLGAKFKDKTIWNPILEKIEHRLEGWKRLYLSKGGRVILIKSTHLIYPLIFNLYFLYLLLWRTELRNFSGISYGVASMTNKNFIWLNGLLFVLPFLQVAWG